MSTNPREPTLAMPGSPEKIDIMHNRAMLGVPIFLPGDINVFDVRGLDDRRGTEPDRRRNGETLVIGQVWMQSTVISVTDWMRSNSVGELIRKLRKENGISMEVLASRSSVHWNSIQFIETNKQQPTVSTFVNLTEALNFTVVLQAR